MALESSSTKLLESIFESEQKFCRASFSQQLEKKYFGRGRGGAGRKDRRQVSRGNEEVEKLLRQVPAAVCVCEGRVPLAWPLKLSPKKKKN